jgi:alkylresorcinol/alkylpyrone synthase
MNPVIVSVGTAVPPYEIVQETSREFARHMFGEVYRDIDRLLCVFESAQIRSRRFCVPIEWFGEPHRWDEKNNLYIENAIRLAIEAIERCLHPHGLTPQDVDHLVFVSSTGICTPSIDAHVFNRLQMRTDLKRTPIWGLGCAGGAVGLARGFDLAAACPNELIVVCALELCGLTFLHADRSKSNLIATSLFGDGAAAVLVAGGKVAKQRGWIGPQVLGSQSTIWPDTLDVMGWDVRDEGLGVIFSRDIPSLVVANVRPEVERFFMRYAISLPSLRRLTAHPGGAKVLTAYEQALDLPPDALRHSRDVLNDHGNMSSCTVLFVLERELREEHEPDEPGLVMALGPGFACEQVLLRW